MARRDLKNLQKWKHLARDSQFNHRNLSKLLQISPRQLQRYTQEYFGSSTQAWLDVQRLKLAAELLAENHSVKSTGLTLGYKQSSHFCRQFRLYYGLPPGEFAKKSQANAVPVR